MIKQRRLSIVIILLFLMGCTGADQVTGNFPGYTNADAGTGPAAGDNGAVAGSAGSAPTGGSNANPDTPANIDAGGQTPIDSGTSDGGNTIEPNETMDSGTTTASDGGPNGVVDTGTTTTNPDTGNGDDPFESVRQVCVDTINEYRATLGLAPLTRASAALEQCSDQGANKDADIGIAHSSARDCPPLGAQNSCPNWRVGAATLAESLKSCLAGMWGEGEPPQGVDQCLAEYYAGNTTCFMTYGHYINMSSPTSGTVACGFYDMGNNTYWMNQNFGY